MKVDVKKKLCGFDGKPIKDGAAELTLADACVTALMGFHDPRAEVPAAEKLRRAILAERVFKAGAAKDGGIELTVEEQALCREMIGKSFVPLVVLTAYRELGGEKV